MPCLTSQKFFEDFSVLEALDGDELALEGSRASPSPVDKKAQKQAQQAARRNDAARKASLQALQQTAPPTTMHDKMHRRSTVAELDAGAAEGGAGGNLLLPPSQLQQGQAAGRMALRAPQGRPATLPPASHRRPQQPAKCIYFARGYCQNGDSCRFEHGSPPGPTKQGAQGLRGPRPPPPPPAGWKGAQDRGRDSSGGFLISKTSDPRLSPQYLRSIGQDPKDLPFYKTVMCNYWRSTGTCHRGDSCTYAHGQHEKRPQHINATVQSDARSVAPAPPRPPGGPDPAALMRQAGRAKAQPAAAPPSAPTHDAHQNSWQQSGEENDLLDMLYVGSGGGAPPPAGGTRLPQTLFDPSPSTSGQQTGEAAAQLPPHHSHLRPPSIGQRHQVPKVEAKAQRPYRPAGALLGPIERPEPRPPLPPQPQQQRGSPPELAGDSLGTSANKPSPAKHKKKQEQQVEHQMHKRFEMLSMDDEEGSGDNGRRSPAPLRPCSSGVPDAETAVASGSGQGETRDEFCCALTLELMRDPAVCADGHSYERSVIEEWLADHDTSPLTGLKLLHKQLVPNHAVAHAIKQTQERGS